MTRTRFIVGLFSAAILCGGVYLVAADATVVPMVARGCGPGGVQVTTVGWAAFFLSLSGTCGFSISGRVVWIAGHLMLPSSKEVKAGLDALSTLPELAESFAAPMEDRSSRAVQRRFVFFLVDAASLLHGCHTSHDNGVIVIRYGGYAHPVSQGATENRALEMRKVEVATHKELLS